MVRGGRSNAEYAMDAESSEDRKAGCLFGDSETVANMPPATTRQRGSVRRSNRMVLNRELQVRPDF